MIKFLMAAVLATALAYSAEPSKFAGTWKLDVAKSNFSGDPAGALQRATLTVKEDGTWTYSLTDSSGKTEKSSNEETDQIIYKSEPTGNSSIIDARWMIKGNGKEVQRALMALMPDGKAIVGYISGEHEDGTAFSAIAYYKKVQ